jgi:hypothetical protein
MHKLAVIILAGAVSPAFAQTYVAPHVRKDGTYVQGHTRTKPNNTVDDNYGTKGNYNPYTGQSGTQPRSYEQPTPMPSYGQTCGYTSTGRYVCR